MADACKHWGLDQSPPVERQSLCSLCIQPEFWHYQQQSVLPELKQTETTLFGISNSNYLQKLNFIHRESEFCKTNCHHDKDTTLVAIETVAFSHKDVYLLKPGCMHAFISQQHCVSQESHYSREQTKEHPSSSKLNLIQPFDILKIILPSTGQVGQSI